MPPEPMSRGATVPQTTVDSVHRAQMNVSKPTEQNFKVRHWFCTTAGAGAAAILCKCGVYCCPKNDQLLTSILKDMTPNNVTSDFHKVFSRMFEVCLS
jgi:hypothetical protein